jgi:hypothetical protein
MECEWAEGNYLEQIKKVGFDNLKQIKVSKEM